MLLVSIAEYFVMTFINALIMPFIRNVFFAGMDIEDLKVGGVIVIFLGILTAILIRLAEYVLPSQIHFLADAAYSRIYATIQAVLYRGKTQVGLSGMGIKEKIMLSVFAAGFFIIVILPQWYQRFRYVLYDNRIVSYSGLFSRTYRIMRFDAVQHIADR